MTINLDTEIVATRYDPIARANYYTILRNGQRYTATVAQSDLDNLGRLPGSKEKRRTFVANALTMAMSGAPDQVP